MVNRRVASTTALLCVLAGCTTLLGIDKDYVEVPGDAGATDGTAESAPPDGAFDAPPVSDGSVDAGAGFCAKLSPKPTFCDDFDLGNPIGTGWSNISQCIGCIVAIDNDASVSPPSSVLTANTPDANFTEAYLKKVLVTPSTQLIVAQADVRMEKAPPDPGSAECPLELGITTASGEWRARLLAYPAKAELEEFELGADASNTWDWAGLAQYLTLKTWVRVRIEVDLVALTSTVYFDGNKVLAAHPLRFKWKSGSAHVAAGAVLYRWTWSGSWSFRVDNVILDAK